MSQIAFLVHFCLWAIIIFDTLLVYVCVSIVAFYCQKKSFC